MHGVCNIIYRVHKNATEAQPGILPSIEEKMRVKGEAERWGGNCTLACVIIRAETIECTQNAEWEIARAANSDCKYGIPWRPVSLRLLCVKIKIFAFDSVSIPFLSTVKCFKLCSWNSARLLFYYIRVLWKCEWNRLCHIAGRNYLALSIVGLNATWLFLDHTRTKETHEDGSATLLTISWVDDRCAFQAC